MNSSFCSLSPVHCSLYPVHCSLYPVYCSLYPVHYLLLSIHSSLIYGKVFVTCLSKLIIQMKSFLVLIVFVSLSFLQAQNPTDYMKQINAYNQEMMQNNWKYLSAVARSKSPSKVERMRRNVESTVRSSIESLKRMPDFQGNDAYRQAALAYQDFSLDLITGKTQKLVDMEAISQDSYDSMEAYVLYQRQLNYLNQAESDKVKQAEKAFAQEFEVELVQGNESDLVKKLKEGSKVLRYKEDMFLVFARASMYEMDMLSRINTSDNYNFAHAGMTLMELVDKSRKVMDTITDINPDLSLRRATTKALDFYQKEADELIPAVNEFQKLQNDFKSFKDKFDATPNAQNDKKWIDQYNQKVENFNAESQKFTTLMNDYSAKRTQNYNDWNQAADDYILKHMPEE